MQSFILLPTAAAAWRANIVVSKAAWWPWPLTFWPGIRVTCDVGYLCANFCLPRPLCSRLRPDVRDTHVRRQIDVRQKHRLMPPPIRERGHHNAWKSSFLRDQVHLLQLCLSSGCFIPDLMNPKTENQVLRFSKLESGVWAQQVSFETPLTGRCTKPMCIVGVKTIITCKIPLPIFPSVLWHCWFGNRKGIRPVKSWALVWLELCLQSIPPSF